MPSALERNGDFSQTRNNAGALRFIRNPSSGLRVQRQHRRPRLLPWQRHSAEPDQSDGPADHQPVPAAGSEPGRESVTQGNYNYQFAGDTEKLRRDNVLRVDWNIRPGTTFYTRMQLGKEVFGRGQYNATAPALIAGAGMGFRWSNGSYDINTAGYVANSHTRSPARPCWRSLAGPIGRTQDVYPLRQADWDALDYRNQLPDHRQYFPENNPNHILPDMTFGRRERSAEHPEHQHRPGPGVPMACDRTRHA